MEPMNRRGFLGSLGAAGVAAKALARDAWQRAGQVVHPTLADSQPGVGTEVLENGTVRVEINPADGNFVTLANKVSGRSYISHPQYARSFRLVYWSTDRLSETFNGRFEHAIESSQQTAPQISRTHSNGAEQIGVFYPQLLSYGKELPISFWYRVFLRPDSDEVSYECRLVNKSPYMVTQAFFPWISGIEYVENREDDRIVFCNQKLKVGDTLAQGSYFGWLPGKFAISYPDYPSSGYHFQVPWVHYGGDHEGLYVASKDHTGERHRFYLQNEYDMKSFDKNRMIYSVAWNFCPYLKSGEWRSPELVLSPHQGDWHVAADKFRETLKGWYQPPETPRQFKESIGSANLIFRKDFNELTEMAQDAQQYGINDVNTWQQDVLYPRPLTKDDPANYRVGIVEEAWGGLERLRSCNETVRAMGMTTYVIFNSVLFVVASLEEGLREKADEWALHGWDGTARGGPLVDHTLWSCYGANPVPYIDNPFEFSMGMLQMCPAVEEYKEFTLNNITDAIARTKYQGHFFDMASTDPVCFNPNHQHSTPKAPSEQMPLMMKELKARLRQNDPQALLIGEGAEMRATQHYDLCWLWNVWGLDSTFDYSIEMLRYSLPWVRIAIAIDDNIGLANRLFVMGIYLALFNRNWHCQTAKLSDWPEFAQHIKKLANLRKVLLDFLLDGRFMDDLGLRCKVGYARVYERADRVAVVVAETEGKAQRTSIELDAFRYQISQASTQCQFVDFAGEQRPQSARRSRSGQLRVEINLEAWQIGALIFSRQAA
jgi:hypothetical protein